MGTFKLGKMTLRSLFHKPATVRYPYEKRDLETLFPHMRGHVVNDIERIGDHASDIAEIVTYLSGACGHNTHIDQMAQATIKMVTDSLDAFVRRDLTLAWSVIEYDDVVDRLFDECKSCLLYTSDAADE